MPRLSLPVASEDLPEVPLYTGNIVEDMATMNKKRGQEIGGKLSYPGKMDCPSWGIPARRCRIGSILGQVKGSVCHPDTCYAKGGIFRFKNVDAVLETNYEKLFNDLWTPAIAAQIVWETDDRFRWFLAGDLLCGVPACQHA